MRFQPVLEDEKEQTVQKSDSNGTLNNTYIKSEFSDSYKACYSNGSTNGFVSQSSKKIK